VSYSYLLKMLFENVAVSLSTKVIFRAKFAKKAPHPLNIANFGGNPRFLPVPKPVLTDGLLPVWRRHAPQCAATRPAFPSDVAGGLGVLTADRYCSAFAHDFAAPRAYVGRAKDAL
jgi:hypothetical protein